ncbi:MAG TPA: pyridoxal-phosphate dependent enzyme [Prolixibacteraceae bacterium]|nr:pyridoxal-phosphate dependent enzyme [Prolixibacteraceae bacterium]
MLNLPVFHDVENAHLLIGSLVHRTPVLTSESINRITGAELFFKCENFQKVGAFKFRGASNAVLSLSDTVAHKGVATHSSGNHAAALALAARNRGITAHVVMPENAPKIKIAAVKSYGANITFCQATLEARESTLNQVIAETGASEIHPYNNFYVIAGQGTAAKELLEDSSLLDMLLCPVGGGGLLSGTAISTKALSPFTKVIACEPAGADDAFRSFYGNQIYPSLKPNTIADGLLTSLGEINYAIIKQLVDAVVTVSEEAIIEAMRMVWERMKIIIEPSSAVPLAAILEKKVHVENLRVGIIISGGNVDLNQLPF